MLTPRSMNLSDEMIGRLAALSRLNLSPEEMQELRVDLSRILSFMEKINEVNLDGVEPLVYLTEEKNKLRPDELNQEISREDALKNAPQHDADYFRVPKIIDRK